jgi:hypothetical protein
VDRRFNGVAVEEKVIAFKYNEPIDGALGRSLVWVLGSRPKEIASSSCTATAATGGRRRSVGAIPAPLAEQHRRTGDVRA